MEVHTGWEPAVLELKLKTKRKCHVDIDISDGIEHSNTAIKVQQQGGSGRCPGYCQSKHAAQDALSAPSQTQHRKKEADRQLDAVFKAASTIEEIAPLSDRDVESALHRQLREANGRVAELEKREAELNATIEELKASAAASVAKEEADRAESTSLFTAKLAAQSAQHQMRVVELQRQHAEASQVSSDQLCHLQAASTTCQDMQKELDKARESLQAKTLELDVFAQQDVNLKQELGECKAHVIKQTKQCETLQAQVGHYMGEGLTSLSMEVLEALQSRMKIGAEKLAEHILCRHKEASDQKLCVVCLEHSSTHVLVPCGHQCLCEHCSLNIAPGLCPMCREPSIMAIKVYEN